MRKAKKAYATPKLTIYGTVREITLQEMPDPPGKTSGAGDVRNTQWPYGKIPGGEDNLVGYSRS